MNLTDDERRMVEESRQDRKEASDRRAQEKARWDAEQKRLDTPGLGCLDCEKTPREVANEGRYVKNDRAEGMGMVQLLQWTGGGCMSEREYTVVFQADLCCSCLGRRVEKNQARVRR